MSLLLRAWILLPASAKAAVHRRAARLALDLVHSVIMFTADGVDSRIVLAAARQAASPRTWLEGWGTLREWIGGGATTEDEALFERIADAGRGEMN